MRFAITSLLVLALALIGLVSSSEERDNMAIFLDNPSLSSDGSTIAFDFSGDIWTVPIAGGEAKRLTIHVAEEKRPLFSPDGRWIVYSAQYFGNLDLFVMPAEGGTPRRLTYNTGSDLASCWSSDGSTIYFYSSNDGSFDVFRIPFDGGTPVRLLRSTRDTCYSASLSPDGEKLAFVHRSSNSGWNRPGWKSPGRAEIFLADNTVPASNITRLTDNYAADHLPLWKPDGSQIYFASDRDGTYNLYEMSPTNGDKSARRITNLKGEGIRWFSVASKSGDVVARIDHRLHRLDIGTGKATLIPITAYNPSMYESDSLTEEKSVSAYSVSPDGLKLAFISGHDVFVMACEGGYAKRLTNTYERELHMQWSSDSQNIIYNRLSDGALNIFRADVSTGIEEQLTRGKTNRFTPQYSSDGEWIYFQHEFEEIRRMKLDGTEQETVAAGMFARLILWHGPWFSISADSEWLLYRESNDIMETDCKLLRLDSDEKPIRVSLLGGSSSLGDISGDMKFLVFSNNKAGTSFIHVITFGKPAELPRTAEEKLEDLLNEKPPQKEEPQKESPPIEPDFSGLLDKTKRLAASFAGAHHSPVILPDNRTVLFLGNEGGNDNVYSINLITSDAKPVKITDTKGTKSSLSVDGAGKFAYFLSGNRIHRLDLKSKKFSSIAPSNKLMRQIEPSAMRQAIFSEALWVLDYGYYDPAHHGVDIEQLRNKHARLVALCTTDEQFATVMADMLSDLNSSHMGYYIKPVFSAKGPSDDTPHLGFFYDDTAVEQGILRVSRLVENTPAIAKYEYLSVGDRIVAINDVKWEPFVNIYSVLRNCINGEMKLLVESADGTSRTVRISTLSAAAFRKAVYNEWVQSNRRYVELKSNDTLGYIYIAQMNESEFRKFKEEAQRYLSDCKGLVFDFRYNGGGSTAHKIVEYLDDTPWLMRRMRGGRWVSEDIHRDFSYQKPVAGLFNYSSFSNAEMMCAGFRIKNLGPSIGTPTAGGVIGTWSKTLLDDSSMRLPQFGVYDKDGRNLEHSPTEPEFIVDENVIDEMNGRHPQLDMAIEKLLSADSQTEKTE